jgi:uncharacterized cupredoxin-like copper-binding protein
MVGATLIGALLFASAAYANGALKTSQDPIEVRLDLGKEGDQKHRFYPDNLTFERQKPYRLVIHNPTNNVHEFFSRGFVWAIASKFVRVMDDVGPGAQPISVIVGAPNEIEVFPGGTVEWTFIPVVKGVNEMICDTLDKDGKTHTQLGMKGSITIK